MQGGYVKPPPDAALAAKGAAKGKKGAKKDKGGKDKAAARDEGTQSGFRVYTSPGGLQVRLSCDVAWGRLGGGARHVHRLPDAVLAAWGPRTRRRPGTRAHERVLGRLGNCRCGGASRWRGVK